MTDNRARISARPAPGGTWISEGKSPPTIVTCAVTVQPASAMHAQRPTINRNMAASGDSLDRGAVEAEVASYKKLAGCLAVEAVEVEVDE